MEVVWNSKFDDDQATFSTLIKEHNGREMPVFFLFFTTESALDIWFLKIFFLLCNAAHATSHEEKRDDSFNMLSLCPNFASYQSKSFYAFIVVVNATLQWLKAMHLIKD